MLLTQNQSRLPMGWWEPHGSLPSSEVQEMAARISDLNSPISVVEFQGKFALGKGGLGFFGDRNADSSAYPLLGYSPALPMENLGDPSFCRDHRIRIPYVSGAMANGIASVELVEAISQAGMLGFFGSAGLSLDAIENAIDQLSSRLGQKPFGLNLIHTPNEPDLEAGVVDLYLRRGIQLVEASAYLKLTLPLVKYRVKNISSNSQGEVVAPNRIIAKVSRIEVATQFFSPPPEKFLKQLVELAEITEEQAQMASEIPMAEDLTAEADSGGHTDNQPSLVLIPAMISLRDRLQDRFNYRTSPRVGAAGGISTPASAAAVFAMGAAYIVTGSINQCCVEAGTSDAVRKLLCQAEQADIAMAPAADMFEMGVNVQVLKRGTLFAMRARKLYNFYRKYDRWESLPAKDQATLEKQFFRNSFSEAWEQTRDYFETRDPLQIERAERDPKHKMALIFRSYLGQSSIWANSGEASRVVDYQIWCGPAMGAFNEWVKGSFLEKTENRRIVTIAFNIMYGAAVIQRLNVLKVQGLSLPTVLSRVKPLELDQIQAVINQ